MFFVTWQGNTPRHRPIRGDPPGSAGISADRREVPGNGCPRGQRRNGTPGEGGQRSPTTAARRATGMVSPAASRAASAPQKASPAPVVSTGVTAWGAILVSPSRVTSRAPRAPSVTTTAPTPASSNAAVPPSSVTSCSFGTMTSSSVSNRPGRSRAGAGLSTTIVSSPARATARSMTSRGTSHCMSSTRAPAMMSAAASTSATDRT